MFRNQTSSEALFTFTYTSSVESAFLRDHCSVLVGNSHFDLTVLKQPDLNSDRTNILDRYKWLHPGCIPPPMPFDEVPLRDLLSDPATLWKTLLYLRGWSRPTRFVNYLLAHNFH
jgi:hypothetical protein